MEYTKEDAIDILERTPSTLKNMLEGISPRWYNATEGKHTWSPKQIIAHLILGEKTDWVPRCQLILNNTSNKKFEKFNMTAHLDYAKKKSLKELLDEFETLRVENIAIFNRLEVSNQTLNKTGIHVEFGEVTLKQHLATWVTHDLGHIAQIARVMAKQYKNEVGPWTNYISILNK